MSQGNFVQVPVDGGILIGATSILLGTPVAPYQLPPANGGLLVLVDSLGRPSFAEIVSYASRTGQTLTGVVRGLEDTAAREWPSGTYAYQSLTAGEYAKVAAAVRVPTASTLTYTAGVLTSIVEIQAEGTKTTTLTYTAGALTSVVTVLNNWTKTDTLTYTAGVLTSTTTSEVYV
jgi:hypothetical protein